MDAYLQSSAVAAQGNVVHEISQYPYSTNPALPGHCEIRVVGVAPGATLDISNIVGQENIDVDSQIVEAIEWAVLHDHVNVLAEPFGTLNVPDLAKDPVRIWDQAAVAAGVTVTVDSGDSGWANALWSPGTAGTSPGSSQLASPPPSRPTSRPVFTATWAAAVGWTTTRGQRARRGRRNRCRRRSTCWRRATRTGPSARPASAPAGPHRPF